MEKIYKKVLRQESLNPREAMELLRRITKLEGTLEYMRRELRFSNSGTVSGGING